MFSMWRLAWIAHALRTAPAHLLDGNILYPATRTLTFSDATLLEGLIATPMLWARVPLIVTYNLLLLAGIAASGLAMFALARRVTGAAGPALVAALIFTTAPYRIEHYMHLELQWSMWIPLTFWALHRTIERRSFRTAFLAGVFLALQAMSCVYYGVFLALACVSFVLFAGLLSPAQTTRAIPQLVTTVAVAALLTAPYAWAYVRTAQLLGPRPLLEVATYSATPASYLTAPPQHWLWSWTFRRWGRAELNLYPGIVATALALLALSRPRRVVLLYAGIALVALELSFGLHGRAYAALVHLGLTGLRSPSRIAIVLMCAIAVLASLGVQEIRTRLSAGRRWTATAAALVLVAADFANTGMYLANPSQPANETVYRMIRSLGAGPIVELPVPEPDRLPGHDAEYEYWSTAHWAPLVNGYSGYYTQLYLQTLEEMRTFPDVRSIRQLKAIGARYLIVHGGLYSPEQARALLLNIAQFPDFRWSGQFRDPAGTADLFLID
jgi:hypothetical protein